jgi:hypothetical protein
MKQEEKIEARCQVLVLTEDHRFRSPFLALELDLREIS